MRSLLRVPSHATVVAYAALLVALGGTAYAAATIGPTDIKTDAVRERHIAPGAVYRSELRANAVTGAKVLDGSLALTDLDITVTTVSVSTPALNGGQCAFVSVAVSGLSSGEGVLAYTSSNWDNRLMIDGVEARGSGGEELMVHLCNWTPSTNLGAGSGDIVILRF
jgi:hypothetical protein